MARTILVVDDIASNRRILSIMLHKEYDVLEAANGEEALAVLSEHTAAISAVLLDISMPGIDGFEVLRRIRANPATVAIPVIMITGSEDEQTRVKSLTLGANDFVMKPYSSAIIKHCLQNNIALREAAATVSVLEKDRLTGLWNRESFFQRAAQEIAQQPAGTLVLGCVDIEGFKVLNDQYGSETGDRILKSIADSLRQSCDERGGICGHLFADQFVALYPAALLDTEAIGAEPLEAEVRERTGHHVTLSIGRYLIDDKSLSMSAMFDRASIAKSTVKGRYDTHIAWYDKGMRDQIVREQTIVNQMNAALANGQFEVWFQPQYNHATEAMIGAEALVRWRHPERGLIPPGEFIPIFERNGFIYSLDQYVWEETCRYLRQWLGEGLAPLPVSVNISRYDLLRPGLVETITGLVQKYELPMALLRLEITESAFSEAAQHIVRVAKELVDIGFTVEIDDFGSGYSSLNTLKDVPAQIIKLDMRFLESSNSERGGNIVESVVRMAKWLGISVIAEGVETLAQADYLRSIGCNYLQGYLYARPMPAEQYLALCSGAEKENRLLALETVENLDNNAFWDPESMDTLIFNSYVGGACIYEYHAGQIELLRATEKFAQLIGSSMTVEDALKLDWAAHLDAANAQKVGENLAVSAATKKEVTGEFVFVDLPGCPHKTYLRSAMRVIATAGDRHLVYCTNENITEQRNAERHEREAAERLQAVMDYVDLGILAVVVENGSARYLFTNHRYYEILGYTKAQFEAEVASPYLTIAAEDRQRVMDETARINLTGKSSMLVYTAVTRDGRRRSLRAVISTAALSGIDVPVQFTILRDITEELEVEQREHNAMAQIQNMMRDIPGGFVRLRLCADGRLETAYCNDGMATLTGMSRDALMALYGRDALAGVHPDDCELARSFIARMLEGDEACNAQYRLRRQGGGYCAVSVLGRKTVDVSGETYLSIYYTDASKQLEKEETQRALLDNLPGGAGLYEYADGQLSVRYLNKSYWNLVGRASDDYQGLMPLSAVHPDDLPIVARELASAIEQKRDMVCDMRLRHETDGYRPVHVTGHIVPVAGRYLIYATFSPITDETVTYQQLLPLLLSAMMDSTTDLSFSKGTDYRYLSASRAFANMAGLADVADVLGKTDYDLFDKELADAFRRDDELLLANGKPLIDRVELISSGNGPPRYASTSKYLLRDGSGKVIGLYGIGRDVTKAVAQDSQLKLVNDSIPGGLVTYAYTAGSLRIVYCNDGFCELFGGTRAGFEQRGDLDPLAWVYEEDRPELQLQIDTLVRDDTPMDCVFRVHVMGGGYKWINEKAVATERRGESVLFNAVLLNITERQNALEQLRISEEENNLAVELGGSIVMRYLVADRTLSISPTVAAAHNLPETIPDVPYEPVRRGLIAPESAEAYIGFFEAILNGSKAGTMLYQQQYFGDWRWMEAKSTTIFSDDGKPVKAVISLFDVTEKLEKETIYKKWQQSLSDRTPESYTLFRCNLNNNNTYDSREGTLLDFELDDTDCDFNAHSLAYARQRVFVDDQDAYLAFVNSDAMLASYYRGKRTDALEYRELQPDGSLRWLRLAVDLVEYPNSTDVEAYLMYEDIDEAKKAELETKELLELDPLTGILNRSTFSARVDELLRLSKPEARYALLMLDIDGFKQVNDVFGHGAGDQALIEMASTLRAVTRRNDLVGRLGGDEFVVFLSGIVDGADAASKAKQIGALARRAFSMEVRISASIGMALAPHDGASFEVLYKKADSALYYVKGSGKDSFAFYHDDMANEHLEPEPDATDDSGSQPREKKRRMLIADDSQIDYALLQNIFQDEFIIEKAKDGNTALIRLRHYGSAISVILLDLMMPSMDGYAVLEKMQESPELRAIPVIIVSGDESRETCLKAIRKGATDFITKPVDADLLRIRVRSAVSKAENERLRAKNRLLEVQNEERLRYEAALESLGVTFIEYDWLTGRFVYYPSISHYLLGVYDHRKLWQILLSDQVADAQTVQEMQQLACRVAESHGEEHASQTVLLKTPGGAAHRFRMNVRKLANEYRLTSRILITLTDLDAEG